MTVIYDYFCTLRLEPNGLIPLTPEEPDDFIHEISGKILCVGVMTIQEIKLQDCSESITRILSLVRTTT